MAAELLKRWVPKLELGHQDLRGLIPRTQAPAWVRYVRTEALLPHASPETTGAACGSRAAEDVGAQAGAWAPGFTRTYSSYPSSRLGTFVRRKLCFLMPLRRRRAWRVAAELLKRRVPKLELGHQDLRGLIPRTQAPAWVRSSPEALLPHASPETTGAACGSRAAEEEGAQAGAWAPVGAGIGSL